MHSMLLLLGLSMVFVPSLGQAGPTPPADITTVVTETVAEGFTGMLTNVAVTRANALTQCSLVKYVEGMAMSAPGIAGTAINDTLCGVQVTTAITEDSAGFYDVSGGGAIVRFALIVTRAFDSVETPCDEAVSETITTDYAVTDCIISEPIPGMTSAVLDNTFGCITTWAPPSGVRDFSNPSVNVELTAIHPALPSSPAITMAIQTYGLTIPSCTTTVAPGTGTPGPNPGTTPGPNPATTEGPSSITLAIGVSVGVAFAIIATIAVIVIIVACYCRRSSSGSTQGSAGNAGDNQVYGKPGRVYGMTPQPPPATYQVVEGPTDDQHYETADPTYETADPTYETVATSNTDNQNTYEYATVDEAKAGFRPQPTPATEANAEYQVLEGPTGEQSDDQHSTGEQSDDQHPTGEQSDDQHTYDRPFHGPKSGAKSGPQPPAVGGDGLTDNPEQAYGRLHTPKK